MDLKNNPRTLWVSKKPEQVEALKQTQRPEFSPRDPQVNKSESTLES